MCLLKTKDFSVFATCTASVSGCVTETLMPANFKFEKGVYALIGDIDCGGWAFVTALTAGGAHADDILLPEGQLYYHNKKALLSEMNQFACSLDHFRSAEDMPETTVRQFVEEGLANSGLPYAADEIRKLFCIDPVRFERPLSAMGNQFFNATAAIGFSQGKEIYCFPWIGTHFITGKRLIHIFRVCNILADQEKLVLLPVSTSCRLPACYTRLLFDSDRESWIQEKPKNILKSENIIEMFATTDVVIRTMKIEDMNINMVVIGNSKKYDITFYNCSNFTSGNLNCAQNHRIGILPMEYREANGNISLYEVRSLFGNLRFTCEQINGFQI